MRKYFLLIVAAAVVFSIPQASFSEIKKGSIEIEPFISYYMLRKTDTGGKGIRLGYNFTERWGIEATYETVNKPADFIRGDVVYHFSPEKSFVPFVFAGAGRIRGNTIREEFYVAPFVEVGAGFKWFIMENIAFRLDGSDLQERHNDIIFGAGLTLSFGGGSSK